MNGDFPPTFFRDWVVAELKENLKLQEEIAQLKEKPTCIPTDGGYECSHCGTSLRADSPDAEKIAKLEATRSEAIELLSAMSRPVEYGVFHPAVERFLNACARGEK